MKRWKIVLPTLLATSGLPLVSLVGCGNQPGPEPVEVKPHVYFNSGGFGTLTGDLDIEVEKGTKWCDLVTQGKVPSVQEDPGYHFFGWFDINNNELKSDTQTEINDNFSVTARFKQMPPVEKKDVYFVSGGNGSLSGTTHIQFELNISWSDITKPTYTAASGYKFGGWFLNGVEIQGNPQFSSDTIIVAQFEPIDPASYTVTLLNEVEDGYSINPEYATPNQPFTGTITSQTPIENSGLVQYVLIDGQPIIGWTFTPDEDDNKKGVLYIPADKVTGNISFYCIKSSDPAPFDFQTDPWQTVAFYANQGLDALCEAYGHEADWFIGKTRNLKMNNQTYEVMVIGTNQDTYTKDGVTYDAALTFKFNNVISDKEGKYMKAIWDIEYSYNYWESKVENALNGSNVDWYDAKDNVITDIKSSVYQMIRASDPTNKWTDLIKSINRTVNTYSDESWKPQKKQVHVFVPTLANLFSRTGLENTEIVDLEDEIDLYLGEGGQYDYYRIEGNIGDSPIGKETYAEFSCLIATDIVRKEKRSCFLSSPSVDTNFDTWQIYSSGSVLQVPISYTRSLAPCFCI